MTFIEPPAQRPVTPTSIVIVRVVVALQVLAGLAVTTLVGIWGLILVLWVGADDGDGAVQVGIIAFGLIAVLIFLLLVLARSAAGLRRGGSSARTRLIVAESLVVGAVAGLFLLLVVDNGDLAFVGPFPIAVAVAAGAVLTLLSTPTVRSWTSDR